MTDLAVYAGLFAAAFLAASIFPAQSELALAALLAHGAQPAAMLIAVASVGNVLGSVLNWALGRLAERFRNRSWFPLNAAALHRAQGWYRRYGRWSLLLSWAPFIGDPLTVAAGVMREPFWSFVALVAVAKTARYLVLGALTLGWF